MLEMAKDAKNDKMLKLRIFARKMVKMQKCIKTDWFILAAQLYPDLKGSSPFSSRKQQQKKRWLKLHLKEFEYLATWYSKRQPHTTKIHEYISAESFPDKCLYKIFWFNITQTIHSLNANQRIINSVFGWPNLCKAPASIFFVSAE